MTKDERGRGTTQGERVESDEGTMRWRWTATQVRGEEAAYCKYLVSLFVGWHDESGRTAAHVASLC
jgi:hypothetical protein